ncbi:MAG: IS3 family transposase [Eggerthellaceae bacterium]|jgi:putative transposase
MYGGEQVELFLMGLEEGMSALEAGRLAGVGASTACNWARGRLPHSYTGAPRARGRMGGAATEGKARRMDERHGLYDPPERGPLSGLNPDQIENLLLRAVLADLKAEGWDPASISNRSKCELGERLRRRTGLPLRSITGFLRISKSSYEYHRARLGRDKYADLRRQVREVFGEGRARWGYRTVRAQLLRRGTRASEKVVRRLMAEQGLRVVYNKRRRRGYSSYEGELSKAPENLVKRDFHADAPDELWVTDITEFGLPCGSKVYLSPVIDCFDGMPVAWSIGTRPTAALANESLLRAVGRMGEGARPVVHSDRGCHYRWPGWISICERHGLVRSMSAKGCSPDNAACEGFFGRLKNEFFYYRDWSGVGAGEFMELLDAEMRRHRDERIKRSLGWRSPAEYRRDLGYTV